MITWEKVIGGRMVNLPLAIVDQRTAVCLDNMYFLAPKYIDRRADPAGRVIYEVRPEPDGASWGSIHLHYVAVDLTLLEFKEPPRPEEREFTPEEWAAIDALPTTEAQDQAAAALTTWIRAETDGLWRTMRQYFHGLVDAFVRRLRDDEAVSLADEYSCFLVPATGKEKAGTRRETRIIRGGSPAAVLIAAAGHDTRLILLRRAEPQPGSARGTVLNRGTPTDDENPAHAIMPPGGSVEALRRGDGAVELVLAARAEDWTKLEEAWAAMLTRLGERGFEVISPDQLTQPPAALPNSEKPQAPAETESEPRGPKAGTLKRVKEAHRLITQLHLSRSKACQRAKTDSRTYDQWCKAATGEDPILAYGET